MLANNFSKQSSIREVDSSLQTWTFLTVGFVLQMRGLYDGEVCKMESLWRCGRIGQDVEIGKPFKVLGCGHELDPVYFFSAWKMYVGM